MAEDRSLTELEREVEQARARLAGDIARLRAPETFESAKRSVIAAVSGYRDDAMGRAQARAQSMLDAVKARASANPAAAAAVMAGVAWRLYRHPPIASALIGAGVAMLARTDPTAAQDRAQERAQERAEEWSRSLSSGWRAQASGEGVESRRVGGALVTERRREESSLEDPREAAQRRDAYLLGFAALALGAAVGVARRRREQVA
jgi:hypothetical protein